MPIPNVKNHFKSLKSDLFFVILFAIFATFYYDSFLTKGPYTNHAWRQTDCLSMTFNYMEGTDFFSPEIHNQLGDNLTSGKTAGEFPILYYIVGQFWKFTGESYFTFRVFYLLILFSGIFALYKSLKMLLKDCFWSTTVALLLFTSPVLVIYGVSFLTDIPAFCFVLIAGYFLTTYFFQKKKKMFWFAMLFFSLAGLIKISSLIGFVFILIVFILENLKVKTLKNGQIFKNDIEEWIGFGFVLLSILSWYSYVNWYNLRHDFLFTFNSIYPLWRIDKQASIQMTSDIKNFTSYFFFSRAFLIVMLFIGTINLFQWKKLSFFGYLTTIAITTGCAIYFLLWAPLMAVHDYYFGALLVLFIGILVPFISLLSVHYPKVLKSKMTKFIGAAFLVYNFAYAFGLVKLVTLAKERTIIRIHNPNFYGKVEYMNFTNQLNIRYEDMRLYLKEIGVKKEDKVISLPDKSFNISLYLMHQKGWTSYAIDYQKNTTKTLIEKGAKYLLITGNETLKTKYLKPYISHQVGDFNGIRIFKLVR